MRFIYLVLTIYLLGAAMEGKLLATDWSKEAMLNSAIVFVGGVLILIINWIINGDNAVDTGSSRSRKK